MIWTNRREQRKGYRWKNIAYNLLHRYTDYTNERETITKITKCLEKDSMHCLDA